MEFAKNEEPHPLYPTQQTGKWDKEFSKESRRVGILDASF